MKTRSALTLAMTLCLAWASHGQDWNRVPGGDVISGGQYLGAAAGSTVPLHLRTIPNLSINMSTEDIRRFRLLPEATYAIGPFGGQVKNGSLLLSPDVDQFYTNGAPGPYSLLHLAAATDNAQVDSYRKWMDLGVSFTGNKDHGYIGNKFGASDYTDMVVHWSDNPGEFMKDRMRFIFTSGYDSGASSGAQSEEGLEFMRMWPNRYEDPHIGVGDFCTALCSL